MDVPDWARTAKYVSLVTFKRDGTGVATPVWFALDADGRLVVYSAPDAGKMKRIRNNGHVELAPCTMKGVVIGPSVTGTAVELTGPLAQAADRLLTKKYGLQKRLIDLGGIVKATFRRQEQASAYISITLS